MSDHQMMYFHTGFSSTLLFNKLKIESGSGLFLACVVFFTITVIYEGLSVLKEHLHKERQLKIETEKKPVSTLPEKMKSRYLSFEHLIESFLHMVHAAIAYLIMLTVMSFNGMLYLSVICGAGFGFFLFNYPRANNNKSNEERKIAEISS